MFPCPDRTVFDLRVSNSALKKSFCFVTVKPNQGGLESRDFCSIITRMIEKYCDKQKFTYEYIENTDFIMVMRINCHVKKLGNLHGLHKLVRVSPFGHGDKIHTSLCKINISGPKTQFKVQIDEKDIRMDFYKSTGPGGQHRNKTMSAVRLVHEPTGVMVTSAAERSQHDNRRYAMEQLQCKLEDLWEDKQLLDYQTSKSKPQDEIVASYYFNHKMAIQEKLGRKTTQLKQLLNGEINLIF